MLRYDWAVLSKYSLNTILTILTILEDRVPLEYCKKNILKPISKFKDTSAFLLNPYGLIANKSRHIDNEIYLYLELAALRSYIAYKQTGSITLPIYYIKNRYNLDKLKLNTSLIVKKEDIVFKYEEI